MEPLPDQHVLVAEGLKVGYQGRAILPPLDFRIRPGELWVLAGRNGSGKSTLLKTLLGLIPPVGGRIIRRSEASITYLPQKQALDPIIPMRVIDIVSEGVEARWSFLLPWIARDLRTQIQKALDLTGTAQLSHRSFTELSEGQKQRVLIARALASAPDLMLLDEPTSSMDLPSEREAIEQIDQLRRKLNTAVLIVSHHLPAAVKAADRVLFVDAEHNTVAMGPVREVAAHPTFRRQFSGLTGELSSLDPSFSPNDEVSNG